MTDETMTPAGRKLLQGWAENLRLIRQTCADPAEARVIEVSLQVIEHFVAKDTAQRIELAESN